MTTNINEIPTPEGYEEVPAGESSPHAQYRCGKCKRIFISMHYTSARMATGRTITCCDEPAWWIRNVRQKKTQNPTTITPKENAETRFKLAEEQIKSRGNHYWEIIANFQVELRGKRWRLVEEYDTGGHGIYEKCELCGFPKCRFKFVIVDPITGDHLSIGDECILNYVKDLNAKEILNKYRKQVTVKLYTFKRNREWYLKILDWEEAHKGLYNSFMVSIKEQLLRGRSLTKKQQEAVEKILRGETNGHTTDTKTIAEYDKLFTPILSIKNMLSEWELSFIQSVAEQVKSGRTLSEKQIHVLTTIPTRHINVKADEETIQKLNKTLDSSIYIFGPVRDIFIDMRNKKLLQFSEKQKSLINKHYQRVLKAQEKTSIPISTTENEVS